jgi:alanine racemase
MFSEHRPVWAEINLDNLKNNIREVRRITKSKEIIAVIKADGYGHGALDIAPTLLENGATRIAVAVVTEAVELRKGGISCPIIILGYTPQTLVSDLVEFDLEQTVYSYELASEISKVAFKANKVVKIHIAVDTGMGRIGFLPTEESLEEVYKISRLPNILLEGIFSHFSSADEENKAYSKTQLDKFNWFYNNLITKGIVINMRHISNSAAIIDLPQAHFDAVRPGIILYGYYPSKEVLKEKITLKPVMTLKANIINIKRLSVGESVSYGRKFITERESVIATLPIGYADGYSRLLFNKAMVIVKDNLVPVVGRICMDQCMIDITELKDIKIGDEVILMGESESNRFNGDDIAKLIGTINYEVTCMISKRVPRVYIKDGEIVKVRNYV